jgi:hypothetical protein
MRLHSLLPYLVLPLAACSSSSPTRPSQTIVPLVVTITPNPMQRRTAGEQIVWNVTFRVGGTTGLRVDRSEGSVLDASGAIFADRKDFWSKSAGCSVCSGDLHLSVGSQMTFSGLAANVLVTPSAGARFQFTTFFTDDSGAASSISTEIPIS